MDWTLERFRTTESSHVPAAIPGQMQAGVSCPGNPRALCCLKPHDSLEPDIRNFLANNPVSPTQFRARILISGRCQVPTLQKLKITSPAHIQIESLADRIREQVVARRAVAVSYGLVGAWASKLVVVDINR